MKKQMTIDYIKRLISVDVSRTFELMNCIGELKNGMYLVRALLNTEGSWLRFVSHRNR